MSMTTPKQDEDDQQGDWHHDLQARTVGFVAAAGTWECGFMADFFCPLTGFDLSIM